jgi:F-type H+-transporting ATPase subunit b
MTTEIQEHASAVLDAAADGAGPVAEAAGRAADAAPGMPQLDFSTFPNQIFWLVVTLVVLYLILSRVALPRIGSVLAERRGTITNDIAAAEEFKLKAAQAEAAYHQALADARSAAAKIVDEAKAEIQLDLNAALAKAEAEIAAKTAESEVRISAIRDSAVEMVSTVASDTTKEILAAFGVRADESAIADAVNAQISQGGAA